MRFTTWTESVYSLLETLSTRVRVLSLNQARLLTSADESTALVPTLERLFHAGLLDVDVWQVPAPLCGSEPLCIWSPGQATPDMHALSSKTRNRWNTCRHQTPVVAATTQAKRLFGSPGGGLPAMNHRDHDLLLSEVFVRYCQQHSGLSKAWQGEDALDLAERGVKNPDAMLVDDEGRVVKVVESAGRYGRQQLESFHRYCADSQVAYELW